MTLIAVCAISINSYCMDLKNTSNLQKSRIEARPTEVWTKPEINGATMQFSPNGDDVVYYLYNREAGVFFTEDNDWGTRASWTSTPKGLKVSFTKYFVDGEWDGKTILINDCSINKGGWMQLFIDSENSCYVDHGSQPNLYWQYEANGDSYRFFGADINPYYNHANYSGYFGIDTQADDTILYPFLNPDEEGVEGRYLVDWVLIPEYSEYFQQIETYTAAHNLRTAIDEILALPESNDISNDIATAENVYANTASTKEELENAISALRYAFNCASVKGATEENPKDATGFLMNPDFSSGDISGWDCGYIKWENVSNLGYQNSSYVNVEVEINGFIEAWAGTDFSNVGHRSLGNGYLSQTLRGLPNGAYTFSCDAIAVAQDDSSTPCTGAYPFAECGDYNWKTEIHTGNGAPEHFEFTFVTLGGDVTMGLKTISTTANWIAADNFKLLYKGEVTGDPNRYVIDKYIAEVEALYPNVEEIIANANVKQQFANALTAAKEATENFEKMQSVLDISVKALESSINAYAEFLGKMVRLHNEFVELGYTEKEARILYNYFAEGIDTEPNGEMPNGSLYHITKNGTLDNEQLTGEISWVYSVFRKTVSENLEEGDDCSRLLINPKFDGSIDGWTCKTGVYGNNNVEVFQNEVEMYQDLENIPDGIYSVGIQAFYRPSSNGNYDGSEPSKVYLHMNNHEIPIRHICSDAVKKQDAINGVNCYMMTDDGNTGFPADYYSEQFGYVPNSEDGAHIAFDAGRYVQTTFGIVKDGKMHIGITSKGEIVEWAIWANFSLTYLGKNEQAVQNALDAFIQQANELLDNSFGESARQALELAIENARIAEGIEDKYSALLALDDAIFIAKERVEINPANNLIVDSNSYNFNNGNAGKWALNPWCAEGTCQIVELGRNGSAYCMQLESNDTSLDENYKAQVAYSLWAPMIQGNTYRMTFYAKTDHDGAKLEFGAQYYPWNEYNAEFRHTFSLTEEWQKYSVEFIIDETYPWELNIIYFNFAKMEGKAFLDCVMLQQISGSNNKRFRYSEITPGTYLLRNHNMYGEEYMYENETLVYSDNGVKIGQDCSKWIISEYGDGYSIQNVASGRYLSSICSEGSNQLVTQETPEMFMFSESKLYSSRLCLQSQNMIVNAQYLNSAGDGYPIAMNYGYGEASYEYGWILAESFTDSEPNPEDNMISDAMSYNFNYGDEGKWRMNDGCSNGSISPFGPGYDESPYCLSLSSWNPNQSHNYGAQLAYLLNTPMQTGKIYELEFYARADIDGTEIGFGAQHYPWEASNKELHETMFSLTQEWELYSLKMFIDGTYPKMGLDNILFNFGKLCGCAYIDRILLHETGEVPNPSILYVDDLTPGIYQLQFGNNPDSGYMYESEELLCSGDMSQIDLEQDNWIVEKFGIGYSFRNVATGRYLSSISTGDSYQLTTQEIPETFFISMSDSEKSTFCIQSIDMILNRYYINSVDGIISSEGYDELASEWNFILKKTLFIEFEDQNVKNICIDNWDTDGDGELSEGEAAAVTDLGRSFQYRNDITSFNELKYFTGLTYINDYTFYCSSINSVDIPISVTYIGDYAFAYCNNLSSVSVHWSTPISINYAVFEGMNISDATLFVPFGTKAMYKSTDVWKEFGNVRIKESDASHGDVNLDGEINVADLAGCVSFILNNAEDYLSFKAADMDDNGEVLVNDLSAIVSVILSQTAQTSAKARLSGGKDDAVTAEMADGLLTIKVDDYYDYCGLQFDVTLPYGTEIVGVNPCDDMHTCQWRKTGQNSVRVILFSPNNTSLRTNNVLTISLRGNGDNDVRVLNMILSKRNALSVHSTCQIYPEITGVISPYIQREQVRPVNLQGISVNGNEKGLLILNGKKYINK